MIISPLKILELNERYNLISGLSERELNNPEGVGFDLRVGSASRISGKSYLGVEERTSPLVREVGDIRIDGNKVITMTPGSYLLVSTMEVVHSPKEKVDIGYGLPPVYLMPDIYPRTSLQRGGISLLATKTDPGYQGKLVFGLKNLGSHNFDFELATRSQNQPAKHT